MCKTDPSSFSFKEDDILALIFYAEYLLFLRFFFFFSLWSKKSSGVDNRIGDLITSSLMDLTILLGIFVKYEDFFFFDGLQFGQIHQ